MKRAASTGSGTSVESNGSTSPSLMNQWKEHYSSRDFTTKPYHLHRMGLFTYFYCLLAVPVICVVFILPDMNLTWTQWLGIIAGTLFVLVENGMNFFACIRVHHDQDVVLCFHCNRLHPAVAPAQDSDVGGSAVIGWRDCLQCQRRSPPRSHHCKLCGECVLRRDHHCYFLCCCIGHHNQKHFLVLSVYTVVALTILSYMVAAGVTAQFDFPWRILLPVTVWSWVTGHCGLGCVFLTLSLYLQLGCLALSCIYLVLETVLILSGQTFYEIGRNVRRFDQGVLANLRSTLGSSWYLWPLLMLYPIDLQQSTDGANWPVVKHQ